MGRSALSLSHESYAEPINPLFGLFYRKTQGEWTSFK